MDATKNGHAPPAPRRYSHVELREQIRQRFGEAVAAGKPRQARRLLESLLLWDGFGGSDLLDRVRPRTNTDGEGWIPVPPSIPSDRRHGSDWWVWRTQQELDYYRQESRLRHAENSYAQGLLKNLTNNVIGKGFSYLAKSLGDDGKPVGDNEQTPGQKAEAMAVQAVIDRFLRLNNWNGMVDPGRTDAIVATREREIFRTQKTDGDALARFHFQDNGDTLVRMIDSAQLRDNKGRYDEGWSYGIQHQMEPFEDVQRCLKYSVFWQDMSAKGGTDGAADKGSYEEIDAKEVVHFRGPDTPSTVKRGLGLFLFGLGRSLDRAAKLQLCTSMAAAVRSAVAETWQFEQATQAQIGSMAQALGERTVNNPNTGQPEQIERVRPGAKRYGPTGATLVPPSGEFITEYMAGVQGDLQQAGAGVCAPAYWFGDTGNVNYNNAESAAAPAVRDGQTEQEYWKAGYCLCVWKAVKWAEECGLLNPDVEKRIVIQVEAPAVLHRNELEKAQEDQIGVQSGWKDRQTCAAERGLDWKAVQANNQEYAEEQGGLMQELGLPGNDEGGGGGGGLGNPTVPKPKAPKTPAVAKPSLESRRVRELLPGDSTGGGAEPTTGGPPPLTETDEPRGGEFKKGGGRVAGKGGADDTGGAKKPHADDEVHSYLDAFTNPGEGDAPPTAKEAVTANKELKAAGSKYRIVPDGKGKWKAAHVGDLNNEFGSGWVVTTNPLTGEPDVGDREYFTEIKALAGDSESRSYVHAFNDPSGGEVKPEDVAQANAELAKGGNQYQIVHSKEYGMWVAKPASA